MRIDYTEIYNVKQKRHFLKISIMALFLSLIVFNSFAEDRVLGTRISFTGGLTYSNMIGDGAVSKSGIDNLSHVYHHFVKAGDGFKLGKKFGIGLIKDGNERFSLGIGINYEEKGSLVPLKYFRYDDDDMPDSVPLSVPIDENTKITLSYLVIPVHLETWFSKFYLNTGFYTAILLNAKNYTEFDFEGEELKWESKSDRHYSKMEVGGTLGCGYAFPVSNRSILKLGLNGNWALTSSKNLDLVGDSSGSFRNQTVQFEIRWEVVI